MTDSCDELKFVYEDKNFKYYLNCLEMGEMLVRLDLTGHKMSIKYALENKYISIKDLSQYPNLILKKDKKAN